MMIWSLKGEYCRFYTYEDMPIMDLPLMAKNINIAFLREKSEELFVPPNNLAAGLDGFFIHGDKDDRLKSFNKCLSIFKYKNILREEA